MLEQEHKDLTEKIERSRRKIVNETLKHEKSIHENTNEVSQIDLESEPLNEELGTLQRENKEWDRELRKYETFDEFAEEDKLIEKNRVERHEKAEKLKEEILDTLGETAIAQK